ARARATIPAATRKSSIGLSGLATIFPPCVRPHNGLEASLDAPAPSIAARGLASGEIDIEVLPVARKNRRRVPLHPRLHDVALKAENYRQLGHPRARNLGHPARRRDLAGIGGASQELLGCAIEVRVLELRAVVPLRLPAVKLRKLVVAGRRAPESAEICLELATLEFLDRVLERGHVKIGAQAHGLHVLLPQRLDLAHGRSRTQSHHDRQRLAVRRLAEAFRVARLVAEAVE